MQFHMHIIGTLTLLNIIFLNTSIAKKMDLIKQKALYSILRLHM